MSAVDAAKAAEAYRNRWTLETMFQSLTQMLEGGIDTLCYPRAALFGFGVALATYNILSTVQAALRAKFGVEKVQQEVSPFHITHEVQAPPQGIEIIFDPEVWEPLQKMSPKALGKELLGWAAHVNLSKYPRCPRPRPPKLSANARDLVKREESELATHSSFAVQFAAR